MMTKEAVNRFLDSKRDSGKRHKTVTTYQERLRSFVDQHGHRPLNSIVEKHVETWAGRQYKAKGRGGRPLSPATVGGRIRALKIFIKWCFDRQYINRNVAIHLKVPKGRGDITPKAMTADDFISMAQAAIDGGLVRDLAILLMLGDTGIRVGELVSMTIGSTNIDGGVATVEGKSGPRWVAFTATTAAAVTRWLDVRPPSPYDDLFLSISARCYGKPMSGNGVRLVLMRLANRAGVSGRCNPHSIRHMVGYLWAQQAPIAIVQAKLGHADLSTTTVYTRQGIGEVQEYTNKLALSNLLSKEDLL